ncbi:MAG: hypothetical protein HYU97_10680 [Deltaproteobacteria bacterium]|nr:hypothetical protein [Deltaproteobacteria bacterium]
MAKVLKNQDLKKKLKLEERVNLEETSSNIVLPQGKSSVIDRDVFEAGARAKAIILEAQAEANQIKAMAKEILNQVEGELQSKKQEGHEVGYQEGLANTTQLMVEAKKLREKLFTDNEKEMIRLVFAIAERVIGDQLKTNNEAVLGVIKQAIKEAMGQKIVIHLNPVDYEKAKAKEAQLFTQVESDQSIAFRVNESVAQGGCLVESEIGTLDAQLETQLTAIKQALGI